jgi:hypothetical protein
MSDPIENRPLTRADLPQVLTFMEARAARAAAGAGEPVATLEQLQAKGEEIARENARLSEMRRLEKSGAVSKGELEYARSLRFPANGR